MLTLISFAARSETPLISISISLDDREDKQTGHVELEYALTASGKWYNVRAIYDWAHQDSRSGTMTAQELSKIEALVMRLPASDEKPIPKAQLTRVTVGGRLYKYNSQSLPSVLKEIFELMGGMRHEAKDKIKFAEPDKVEQKKN